jgi:restriction endonuclease S subunit
MKSVAFNLANLKPNLEWASLPLFDRTGWKRVRFGDFVENIGERAEPKDAQEEIYVGLEHIDPQSLHIRRWGKGSDVTGTKLRFRKGDIIFGRRRAYQRKLAVAEFDGICSAHAMVVRGKPDMVLPEFLPFLMMSDRFMNRAVEISVGSLSPTINWTTLKLEEFDLPRLDQQRRIAEILWAVDEVKEKWLKAQCKAEEAVRAYAAVAFEGVTVIARQKGVSTRRFGEAFTIRTGGTPSRANPAYWGGSIPWVKTGEIKYEDIFDSEEKITELGYKESAARLIPKDSVLMALYGQGPTLGRVAQLRVESTVNQACAAIFPAPEFNMRYVYQYLANQYTNIRSLARGASQPNINAIIVKDFFVPSPHLSRQQEVVAQFAKHDEAQQKIVEYLKQNANIQAHFINSIL